MAPPSPPSPSPSPPSIPPSPASEGEDYSWVPRSGAGGGPRYGGGGLPKMLPPPAAPIAAKPHPTAAPESTRGRLANATLGVIIVAGVIVACALGPAIHFGVVVPARQRAAAEQALRDAYVEPPLPPMAPVTARFFDSFAAAAGGGLPDLASWAPLLGNGLDKGWDFYGQGLGELQCYTGAGDNVAVVAASAANASDGGSALRLQAVPLPSDAPCLPGTVFAAASSSWTSGGVRTIGRRVFQVPPPAAPLGPGPTPNATSLFVEARVKWPVARGVRASLVLLPEPQNQTLPLKQCRAVEECGKFGRWPNSGEIDIAVKPGASSIVSAALQLSEYGQHAWRSRDVDLADRAAEWVVHRVEVNADYIRWYVDGVQTFGVSRFGLSEWPFMEPFYLSASLAVGGRLADPNVERARSELLIDWVRAWTGDADAPPPTAPVAEYVQGGADGGAAVTAAAGPSSNGTTTAGGGGA